ncbi:THAP domain-containing protein 1-like isoform X3 [Dermacentor silvarum]|uniref:THAP domain-containing protein 1-like isoform X3 n=1 Tax=Dermacentor silvarum TaxID=543639 RepID=UPI002100E503|nr:THAP domain-containing protein 1-like isoform X3 [Dermacentor silvarum]
MPCCCAYNCCKKPEDGIAVFVIPQGKRDVLRRRQWLLNIGRKDFVPTRNSVVCELHFTEDQFEPHILRVLGKKKLKPNAVPTVFDRGPVVRHKKPPRQRREPRTDSKPVATGCLPENDKASEIGPAASPSEISSPSQDCCDVPGVCHEPVLMNAHAATICFPEDCVASPIGPTTSPSEPCSPSQDCCDLPVACHEPILTNGQSHEARGIPCGSAARQDANNVGSHT